MAQQRTKLQKRRLAAQTRYLEELEDEKEKLDYIRDAVHVFDAIQFYMSQPHLKEAERDKLRMCMLYLSHGVLD
jgi:hypothetical protein